MLNMNSAYQFKWLTRQNMEAKKLFLGLGRVGSLSAHNTDGRMDRRTNGWMDGRTDRQTVFPSIYEAGISQIVSYFMV